MTPRAAPGGTSCPSRSSSARIVLLFGPDGLRGVRARRLTPSGYWAGGKSPANCNSKGAASCTLHGGSTSRPQEILPFARIRAWVPRGTHAAVCSRYENEEIDPGFGTGIRSAHRDTNTTRRRTNTSHRLVGQDPDKPKLVMGTVKEKSEKELVIKGSGRGSRKQGRLDQGQRVHEGQKAGHRGGRCRREPC